MNTLLLTYSAAKKFKRYPRTTCPVCGEILTYGHEHVLFERSGELCLVHLACFWEVITCDNPTS